MKHIVCLLVALASLISFAVAGSADKIDINAIDLSTLSDAQLMTLRFRIDEKLGTKKLSFTFKLDELSYGQLIALKDQINLAMWQSEEWQEVTVPQGVWEVGADIPVGHWTISACNDAYVTIKYGDELQDNEKSVSWSSNGFYLETLTGQDSWLYSEGDLTFTDINMKQGFYIEISGGSVIFTPYTGKPSLGFK